MGITFIELVSASFVSFFIYLFIFPFFLPKDGSGFQNSFSHDHISTSLIRFWCFWRPNLLRRVDLVEDHQDVVVYPDDVELVAEQVGCFHCGTLLRFAVVDSDPAIDSMVPSDDRYL